MTVLVAGEEVAQLLIFFLDERRGIKRKWNVRSVWQGLCMQSDGEALWNSTVDMAPLSTNTHAINVSCRLGVAPDEESVRIQRSAGVDALHKFRSMHSDFWVRGEELINLI